LNGWLGNKRIIMSEEEKHSYFKKAIDQLALIHYYGMRIKGLKRPYENDKNYFTNRIVKIMFGKLENEIGIKIEEGFIHEFINHYQAINDALVELSKIFPGYYKDAAPRNDIITSNGEIIPVDFESSRILYRGLDIISKLEAGWDFPEDDIATVYLGDLVNENEFQNLVLRYILRYESVKLSEEYKHRRGKTRNVLEEKIKSLDEILKNRDLDEYGSYEKAANEARVLPDNYILFLDTVRSLARIQRHFEYTGYSARDIREAIRRKDKFGIDVNIRAVNYHLEKALGGLYWFAEPKTWNMRLSQPFINEVYIAAPKLYKLAEPLLNILDIKQIKDTVKQKFVV